MGVFFRQAGSRAPLILDGGLGSDMSTAFSFGNVPWATDIFVGVHWAEGTATDWPVTLTIGGVAATEIGDVGFGPFLNVFHLAKPPKGASLNVTATWVGAGGLLNISALLTFLRFAGSISYEGLVTGSATSTTPSLSISTSVAQSAAIGFYTVDLTAGASTATVGSDETSRVNSAFGSGVTAARGLVSSQLMNGDGIINWTLSASRTWYGVAFDIPIGGSPRNIIQPQGIVPINH